MVNEQKYVFDTHGRKYELVEKIGEGGQGVVWATNYDKILVKVISPKTEASRKNYYRRINYIMLRDDLPHKSIAVPKDILIEPDCGYIMELMDDMKSLDEIISPSSDEEDITSWYLAGGGIRRRVYILHKLAEVISEIHEQGFLFGDLSPNNIFVSQDAQFHEVQLIDCDNMSPRSTIDGNLFYTQKYAAPELIKGKTGYDTLTDVWSFAVIAYQLLTLRHPFLGDIINEGEPELEEKAFCGEFPWVEDLKDKTNQCTTGLDSELVAFEPLRDLFHKTFSGGKKSWDRPGILEWHNELQHCLKRFLLCDNSYCGEYFIADRMAVCPFCETQKNKNAVVLLKFARWIPDADVGHRIMVPKYLRLPKIFLNKGESFEVDSKFHCQDDGEFEIQFDEQNDCLKLELKDGIGPLKVIIRQKIGNDVDEGKEINFVPGKFLRIRRKGDRRQYSLHFGDIKTPHRIITFSWEGDR